MKTLNKSLLKLSLFCIIALAIRVGVTGRITFIFLAWNLLLAWAPWLLINKMNTRNSTYLNYFLFYASIAFLPNACYLITDFIHLKTFNPNSRWYDSLLLFSFALNGLLLHIMSFRNIMTLSRYYGFWKLKNYPKINQILLLVLCAFGIYLGRDLRLNSWEILSNPLNVLETVFSVFTDVDFAIKASQMTAIYTGFLWVVGEVFTEIKNSRKLEKNYHNVE